MGYRRGRRKDDEDELVFLLSLSLALCSELGEVPFLFLPAPTSSFPAARTEAARRWPVGRSKLCPEARVDSFESLVQTVQ